MGEQPIFTTKAHVFQIDPNTKKKWLPASSQAISVSYYYDSTRNSYRIISVEGSKAVINSTISPNMMFTKTSQKFGQWSDPRANTVYGLGFASEAELSKFIEKFKEVKELTRQALQKAAAQTNGTQNDTTNHVQAEATASPVALSKPASLSSLPQSDSSSLGENRNSGSAPSLPTNTTEAQLKYENDRLKIALAQSSTNAKKWEVELQTLKNNNARLTTALQESTANVEEWKKQLAMYKEESARMKKKALEIEKGGNPGADAMLQEQMSLLAHKVSELEKDNQKKEQEIGQLNKKLEEIRVQKDEIQQEKDSLQKKLEAKETAEGQENQRLLSLQWQLSSKVSELNELSNQLVKKS